MAPRRAGRHPTVLAGVSGSVRSARLGTSAAAASTATATSTATTSGLEQQAAPAGMNATAAATTATAAAALDGDLLDQRHALPDQLRRLAERTPDAVSVPDLQHGAVSWNAQLTQAGKRRKRRRREERLR